MGYEKRNSAAASEIANRHLEPRYRSYEASVDWLNKDDASVNEVFGMRIPAWFSCPEWSLNSSAWMRVASPKMIELARKRNSGNHVVLMAAAKEASRLAFGE